MWRLFTEAEKPSPPQVWTILQDMPCSTRADLMCVIIVYTASARGINGHPVTLHTAHTGQELHRTLGTKLPSSKSWHAGCTWHTKNCTNTLHTRNCTNTLHTGSCTQGKLHQSQMSPKLPDFSPWWSLQSDCANWTLDEDGD